MTTVDNTVDKIQLKDKSFVPYISAEQIAEVVQKLAQQINQDYVGKTPHFIVVLHGSFVFAADLLRQITLPCNISFIKLSSYLGTTSTAQIKVELDLDRSLRGEDVIVIEDIVDTGNTLEFLREKIGFHQVASFKILSLLLKPDAFKKDFPIDYVGIEIPNYFVVGYGLDYDQYGRNLKGIYQVEV